MRIPIFAFLLLFSPVLCFAEIEFDSVDDWINATTMGSFGSSLSSKYAVVYARFKTYNNTNQARADLFSVGELGKMYLQCFINADSSSSYQKGYVLFFKRDSDGWTSLGGNYTDTGINDGNFHTVVWSTGNSTNAANIWVDGTAKTVKWVVNEACNKMLNPTLSFGIGALNYSGGQLRNFNGTISEIAVWSMSTAPSAQMVNDLNTNASCIRNIPLQYSSGLQLYYRLDDVADGISADNKIINDYSGSGNSGSGNDGANNAGLKSLAETKLSYPED